MSCCVLLQVEDDKAQITAVIQQLDEKKRVALEETWKHVSQRGRRTL
jgi:chromosome segregation ATPase